ncbi:MAG: LLM class flavin-dependent oxidoreductase [Blastocatellia bacterium]|nr:LLM class flavin-dependent oxidoreductase [Blastocatellia bacterium]
MNSTKLDFSFLFFSDVRDDVSDQEKYRFMREIALFGDHEGFRAIYLPERHFYEFGSIYPNQAVVASWLAPQTRSIRFRTAGVSLPLHHPAEVVEWWSVVDVLSGGRVDLGFGSGWNKADFIFSPDTYYNRKEVMSERIEVVRRLWRGEKIGFPGPDGNNIAIQCFPRPLQKEINVWLLVAQNDESFRAAGAAGYNIFTMLYGYDLDMLTSKVKIYRDARRQAGYDPDSGIVSLMLHTFILNNSEEVRREVEKPFKKYIASAVDSHLAARAQKEPRIAQVTEEEKEKILDYSFRRYYQSCALFGTVDECRNVVNKAIAAGVNDIACLVDFGVDYGKVIDSLPFLKTLVSSYM